MFKNLFNKYNKLIMTRIYKFKGTLNEEYWESYIDRKLTNEEQSLIHSVKCEKILNLKIQKFNEIIMKYKLYISHLTLLKGNCLFECFEYFNITNDVLKFRKILSFIMLKFKDFKNFFPDQSSSLNELFISQNEIENVYCQKTKKLYKYDYNTMCCDIVCDGNWERLPTHLLLMVISYIYHIKINIYHNNDYKTEIFMNTSVINININIGLLNEFHYFPLDNLENKQKIEYKDAHILFKKWIINISDSLDKYTISDS